MLFVYPRSSVLGSGASALLRVNINRFSLVRRRMGGGNEVARSYSVGVLGLFTVGKSGAVEKKRKLFWREFSLGKMREDMKEIFS